MLADPRWLRSPAGKRSRGRRASSLSSPPCSPGSSARPRTTTKRWPPATTTPPRLPLRSFTITTEVRPTDPSFFLIAPSLVFVLIGSGRGGASCGEFLPSRASSLARLTKKIGSLSSSWPPDVCSCFCATAGYSSSSLEEGFSSGFVFCTDSCDEHLVHHTDFLSLVRCLGGVPALGRTKAVPGRADAVSRRAPLGDIGNLVTAQLQEQQVNRPVTRSFGAQLVKNAQANRPIKVQPCSLLFQSH